MKEDIKTWVKLLWKVVWPIVWVMMIPFRILGWLNCVVAHKKTWIREKDTHWEEDCEPYGIGRCFGVREHYRCTKCSRHHKGRYYQTSWLGGGSKGE